MSKVRTSKPGTKWVETTCPFCSCCCDDIKVRMEGSTMVEVFPSCPCASSGFLSQLGNQKFPEDQGNPVTWKQAVQKVARSIADARLPVILLGKGVSFESCSEAVELARRFSACLDCCDADLLLSGRWIGETGINTCTLGEIRDQSDLIVFWGANPMQSHPRIWKRFINQGKEKTVFAINSDLPDQRNIEKLTIQPEQILEAVTCLRLAVKGQTGFNDPNLSTLLNAISKARCGVFLVGDQLIHRDKTLLIELRQLVKDLWLAYPSHWYALQLVKDSGVLTESQCLLEKLGFPSSVRFQQGIPKYSPIEWGIERLLESGTVDLVLCVGQPSQHYESLLEDFGGVRIILSPQRPVLNTALWLPVSQIGWDSSGTILRLDGLPIRVPSLIAPSRPSMTKMLQMIESEVVL